MDAFAFLGFAFVDFFLVLPLDVRDEGARVRFGVLDVGALSDEGVTVGFNGSGKGGA